MPCLPNLEILTLQQWRMKKKMKRSEFVAGRKINSSPCRFGAVLPLKPLGPTLPPSCLQGPSQPTHCTPLLCSAPRAAPPLEQDSSSPPKMPSDPAQLPRYWNTPAEQEPPPDHAPASPTLLPNPPFIPQQPTQVDPSSGRSLPS